MRRRRPRAWPSSASCPALGPTTLVGVERRGGHAARARCRGRRRSMFCTIRSRCAAPSSATSCRGRCATQLVGDVALEFGVWKRLALAVGVPVVLYAGRRSAARHRRRRCAAAATVAGDIRVRAQGVARRGPNGSAPRDRPAGDGAGGRPGRVRGHRRRRPSSRAWSSTRTSGG